MAIRIHIDRLVVDERVAGGLDEHEIRERASAGLRDRLATLDSADPTRRPTAAQVSAVVSDTIRSGLE